MGDNPLILTELSSLEDLQAPLKRSARLKYNCMSVTPRLIALGSNTGGVYLFARDSLQLLQIVFADKETSSVTMVALSPNEKFVALVVGTGAIHVVDLRLESRSKPETIKSTSDLGAMATTLHWDNSSTRVYVGDDMGKVSMVPVSSYKAKNLFSLPLEVLLRLDSCVVQIDEADDKLLVSTVTRCYLCDHLKEQYTQIGEKLRNGHFGACLLKRRSMAPTLYCARPGSRIWEVDFEGVVLNTHQFKQLLAVRPLPLVSLDSTFVNRSASDQYPAQGLAFPKLKVLRDTVLVSWTASCLYVLDPVNVKVILWCNAFSGIQDVCCLGNELYIFLQTMKIHCLSLSPVVEVISLCLKSEHFVNAANLCIYFQSIFLNKRFQKQFNVTELYHLYDNLTDTNQIDLANKINSVIVSMETKTTSGSETESIASSRSRSSSSVSRQSGDVVSLVVMETVEISDPVTNNRDSGASADISRENKDTVQTPPVIVQNCTESNESVTNNESDSAGLKHVTTHRNMSHINDSTNTAVNGGIDIPDGDARQFASIDRGIPDGDSSVEPSCVGTEVVETVVKEASQSENKPRESNTDNLHCSQEPEYTNVENKSEACDKLETIELNRTVEIRNHSDASELLYEANVELEGKKQVDENENLPEDVTDHEKKAAETVINVVPLTIEKNPERSKVINNEGDVIAVVEPLRAATVRVAHPDIDNNKNMEAVEQEELKPIALHTEVPVDNLITTHELDKSEVGEHVNEENCADIIPNKNMEESSTASANEQCNVHAPMNEVVFKIGEECPDMQYNHNMSGKTYEIKNKESDLTQHLTLGHAPYVRSPSPLSPSAVAMAMKHDGDLEDDLEFYVSRGMGPRRTSLTSLSSYDSADIGVEQATWNDPQNGSEEIAKPMKRKSSRKKHRRSLDDPGIGKKSERLYNRSYSVGAIQPLAGTQTIRSPQSGQGTITEDCHTISSTQTETMVKQAVTQSPARQLSSESRSVPNLYDYEMKQNGHPSPTASAIFSSSGDTGVTRSSEFGHSGEFSPSQSPLSASWDGERELGTSPTTRSTLVQLKNRVKTKVKSQTQQLVKNIKDKHLLSRAKEFAGSRPQLQDNATESPDWLLNGELAGQETESSVPLFSLGVMPLRLVDIEVLKEATSVAEKKLQDISVLMDPEAVYITLLDWITALNKTFHKLHSIKFVKLEQNTGEQRLNENGCELLTQDEAETADFEQTGFTGVNASGKSNTEDNAMKHAHQNNKNENMDGVPLNMGGSKNMASKTEYSNQSFFTNLLPDQEFCYTKDPIFLPPEVFRGASELAEACFDLGCHGNILKYRYCGNIHTCTCTTKRNDEHCDTLLNDLQHRSDIEHKGCLDVKDVDRCNAEQICDSSNLGTKEASYQQSDVKANDSIDGIAEVCVKKSEVIDSNHDLVALSEVEQSGPCQTDTRHQTTNNDVGTTETNHYSGTVGAQQVNCAVAIDTSYDSYPQHNEQQLKEHHEAVIVTDNHELFSSHVTMNQHRHTEEQTGDGYTRNIKDPIHEITQINQRDETSSVVNSEKQLTDKNDLETVETIIYETEGGNVGQLALTKEDGEQRDEYSYDEDTAMSFYVRCYFPYLSVTKIREWTLGSHDNGGRYQTWCALLACMEAVVSENGDRYGVGDDTLISHVLETNSASDSGGQLLGLISRVFLSSRKIIDICLQCHPYIVPLDVLYLCKYHGVAMETVFKQYMLQMIESAVRTHRKDTLATLYKHEEVRLTWLDLLLREHTPSAADDNGHPRVMSHQVQWENGSRIDDVLDLSVSSAGVSKMLELCRKYGYWKGCLRLQKQLGRGRDHLGLVLQLGDIKLIQDTLYGYLPTNISEWEELLLVFNTYQQSWNQTNTKLQSDWPDRITWDNLSMLLVKHVGPEKAVSLLQNCDVLEETLSASFYQTCLISGIVRKHQRLVLHSMLEKIDTYLWSQRPGILSPQLQYAVVKERQLQTGEPSNSDQETVTSLFSQLRRQGDGGVVQRYMEDPECHWGVRTNLNTVCPCCGIGLKDPVSHTEPGVLLFRCGHGFHKLCLPDRECFLCGPEMMMTPDKPAFI